jgi:hypothetical protein
MKAAHEYETKTEQALDQFVEKMRLKLRQNQAEKGDSWKTCDIRELIKKLDEEYDEYLAAEGDMSSANECVDMGNVCMMLYDRHFNLWAKKAGKIMPHEWER